MDIGDTEVAVGTSGEGDNAETTKTAGHEVEKACAWSVANAPPRETTKRGARETTKRAPREFEKTHSEKNRKQPKRHKKTRGAGQRTKRSRETAEAAHAKTEKSARRKSETAETRSRNTRRAEFEHLRTTEPTNRIPPTKENRGRFSKFRPEVQKIQLNVSPHQVRPCFSDPEPPFTIQPSGSGPFALCGHGDLNRGHYFL